ncbi:MAG: TetR/AcrR family transcriptional regulator [Pseudomonadales bacterium]
MGKNKTGEVKTRLLQTGEAIFSTQEVSATPVAQILTQAGITRRTFYRYYANKHELAADIVRPVFTESIITLELMTDDNAANIDRIIDIYIGLDEKRRDALNLSSRLDPQLFALVADEHNAYVAALLKVLERLSDLPLWRNPNPAYNLQLIARTAIPILKICREQPGYPALYRATIRGMLLK